MRIDVSAGNLMGMHVVANMTQVSNITTAAASGFTAARSTLEQGTQQLPSIWQAPKVMNPSFSTLAHATPELLLGTGREESDTATTFNVMPAAYALGFIALFGIAISWSHIKALFAPAKKP